MPKISHKDLAQMMMVGFEGHEISPFYQDWLKKGLGGIILFSRNIADPAQLSHLTDEIQALSRSVSPCLIGADQEGGRVFRLRAPFTHFPTAQVVGKSILSTDSTALAYESAKATALELAAMGIRLNFAPVLDVNTNDKNPIIGDRAFSDEPELVARAGIAIMRGFEDVGVLACGKHFPGHGRTSADSHLELPVVESTLEELSQIDLIPFERTIFQGLEMIMPAHVLYPAVDPDWPATLSEKILSDLLRYKLQFKGVVISDDLEMKAIMDRYEWREVVVRAIRAGIDILLVCKSQEIQEKVFEALIDAVETKDLEVERIQKSLKKIKDLKKKYLKNPRPFPEKDWQALVGCHAHQDIVSQLSRYA